MISCAALMVGAASPSHRREYTDPRLLWFLVGLHPRAVYSECSYFIAGLAYYEPNRSIDLTTREYRREPGERSR